MRNSDLNHLLKKYTQLSQKLAQSREVYEKYKRQYRTFAESDNQLGKHTHYEPPLTRANKNIIRNANAEMCRKAKYKVRDTQREFENFRKQMVRTLQENGLTLYSYKKGACNLDV